MNILHVSLGVPPLRTGGMTRYCVELAQAQVEQGDSVSLLFPGRFLPGKTRIKQSLWGGLAIYEIVNPLPVALTYGVDDPLNFTTRCNNPTVYQRLLESIQPDAIHVHCYQGVHREFFKQAKRMGINMLFTTHDYYPMCPRCTLITPEGGECRVSPSAEACAHCNCGRGMTFKKSVIMQSGAYAFLKDSALVRKLGGIVKKRMRLGAGSTAADIPSPSSNYTQAYNDLLKYNRSIFSLFDVVLANSTLTEKLFRLYFPKANYVLLPITHAGLSRKELKRREVPHNHPLRIAYFGGGKQYKGFDTLSEAMRILDKQGVNVELSLYGDDYAQTAPVINSHVMGRISPNCVSEEMAKYDAVIVPSTYHETFGFVVLEALCEGVPVVCSDVVGAKDLVDNEFIFRAADSTDLAATIERLIGRRLVQIHISAGYPLSMLDQAAKLRRDYYPRSGVQE